MVMCEEVVVMRGALVEMQASSMLFCMPGGGAGGVKLFLCCKVNTRGGEHGGEYEVPSDSG